MATALAEKIETLTEPRCRPARNTVAPTSPARDVFARIPDDFRLASGEALEEGVVRGRLHGPKGAPLVVVAGGISSGRFVHRTETSGLGWWADAVAVGGPIDLNRFQVLSFDFAPGNGAGDGAPLTVTTHDQARLLAVLLDHLAIQGAEAFIGCSYGGMVALAFAEAFPERVRQLVVISAAHRPHPLATGWRGVQRRILQLALEAGRPEEGVALARELAMTTYRTPEEFAARFDSAPPERAGGRYPVCDYLGARGRDYPSVMSARRWLTLSDSIDRHAVAPERITTPTTLIAFDSDRLVPIDDMRELAGRLPNLYRLIEETSLHGHDAFLKEGPAMAEALSAILKDIDA